MVVIKKFTFGPFSENTFVVWDEKSGAGAVVDPGCFSKEEEDLLADFIEDRGINVKYLIVTHGHIDHVAGCDFVYHKYTPQFFAPHADSELIANVQMQGNMFGMKVKTVPSGYEPLTEKTEIYLGSSKMEFIFTPGHTPGEHCIYFPEEKICITGDVLFQGSIGRTDLWGGDYDVLMNSIFEKLLILPDDTIIYPGHGSSSKIGIEKRDNSFLNF
ncbi:MAG: MBL fold metallo-hydrolase [Methanococcaceae archaeon]